MRQTGEVERAAFEGLYREHYWALLRFAVRRLPDQESARDLVADTFAVAWRRRQRIPPDRVLPWLYSVAGKLLANRRRSRVLADDVTRRLSSYAVLDHAAGPEERAEWTEVLNTVLEALRTLHRRDQEVLLLHAWEGLQGDDLAAALGCSTGAAAVRLHRARRRLRAAQDAQPTSPPAEPYPSRASDGVTT
ncbi:RNA polymerase sigma factor [Kribbella monticola]|uniref:RNA polymerase sigma factor n=1 Tax=Kribbella monticola TaxID=2185285 RepID=UPI000DD412F8|nr:sigma-70 family RNA polymerase sigma factor [Kribbella monticola]